MISKNYKNNVYRFVRLLRKNAESWAKNNGELIL